MLGYIVVLPRDISAYRYIVLRNNARGEGQLQKCFHGETLVRSTFVLWSLKLNLCENGAGTDIFTENMYLSEDHVRGIAVRTMLSFST